ncbi:MAG: polysaccharide biosynthesis protein [Nitrospinaceae bacterium]|nr:polysaccharide biosynthesis protein [Nitrospinaceae bacterium]MBT6345437.1 polysaccharide biosynthesis protein [Nitrospina sp.]
MPQPSGLPPLEVLALSPFRRFIANISWNVLGKVCVQILLFGVSILLTRYLGKERLGIYATLLVIPSFVRLLNQFGLETLINKKLPELIVQDPSGQQGRYLVRKILAIRVTTTLAFGAALYAALPHYLSFIRMPELMEYRFALIAYFFTITLNSIFSTLFMTRLEYKTITLSETVCALLNLCFLGIFIYLDYGIVGVLYAYTLSTAVNILIYFALTWESLKGPTQAPDWQEMRPLASASYFITLLSFGLITQSDILLMNYFQVEPAGIGFYHLATGLGGMLAFVLVGVGPLALSILSETYARESAEGLSRIWCQIVGFASFLTVPIFVFAGFNAESLIHFVYGEEFQQAGKVLAFYILFIGCATIAGADFVTSTLFILHRRDAVIRVTVEGSLLNIGLNFILIPLYQETGAVAGTGTAMVYMVFRQLFMIQKQIQVFPVFPIIGKCLLFSLLAVLPAQTFAILVLDQVLLTAMIYAMGFVILLALLKPFTTEQAQVLSAIHPKVPIWIKGFVRLPVTDGNEP